MIDTFTTYHSLPQKRLSVKLRDVWRRVARTRLMTRAQVGSEVENHDAPYIDHTRLPTQVFTDLGIIRVYIPAFLYIGMR